MASTAPAFRASASHDRILLSVGPVMAETLSLYLEREGFEEEAGEVWAAMEAVLRARSTTIGGS